VRDGAGQVLARHGSADAPLGTLAAPAAVTAIAPAAAVTAKEPGSRAPGIVGLALAVAAAGAGTALQLHGQQLHRLAAANGAAPAATQLNDQGIREAWASVGCFAGAGLFGVLGVVLIIALP
jgi:hypothetical protein